MKACRPLATNPGSLLDSLLGQAFHCAVGQRKHEIAEIILQVMEAHAEDTGDETGLNAAYLRGVRSVTTLAYADAMPTIWGIGVVVHPLMTHA